MLNLSGAIDRTVSISQFHEGMAEQIFSDVRKSGAKVVINNNEPVCVLMSPSEYMDFMDELAEAKLKLLTLQRIVNGSFDHTSAQNEVMESFGITYEELDAMGEVEIECAGKPDEHAMGNRSFRGNSFSTPTRMSQSAILVFRQLSRELNKKAKALTL